MLVSSLGLRDLDTHPLSFFFLHCATAMRVSSGQPARRDQPGSAKVTRDVQANPAEIRGLPSHPADSSLSLSPIHSLPYFFLFFLLNLLFILFYFIFFVAYKILVPRPGIKPVPPALKARSFNHWTTREVPLTSFFPLSLFQ